MSWLNFFGPFQESINSIPLYMIISVVMLLLMFADRYVFRRYVAHINAIKLTADRIKKGATQEIVLDYFISNPLEFGIVDIYIRDKGHPEVLVRVGGLDLRTAKKGANSTYVSLGIPKINSGDWTIEAYLRASPLFPNPLHHIKKSKQTIKLDVKVSTKY